MSLHVCVLWKVDHVLKRFAADHNLALDCLRWIRLLIQFHLTVHCSHVSPDLQVGEYFPKFAEVSTDKSEDSIADHICSGLRFLSWVLFALDDFVCQAISSFKNDHILVLVIQADQNQLNLLKEPSSHYCLSRQDIL